jgi:RHS repeat-associated protein
MVFAMQVTRQGSLAAGSPSVPGSTQTASLRYFHHDQLGSTIAVSDQAGQVIERMAYDPWGKRRNTNGLIDASDSIMGLTTDRGFTGHEHLDEMGIIHMNGRIFDPLMGRFMSADPFIQEGDELQSYNRYSYVMNNPLNATDPSGFISLRGLGRALDRFVRSPTLTNAYNAHRSMPGVVSVDNFVVKHKWAYAIGKAAAGYWGGPWAAAGATGYYTRITTGSDSEAVKAFGISIATSYGFQWAGDVGEGQEYGAQHYASHAAVGCASSVASGGKCGAGALSAVAGLAGTQFSASIGSTAGRFAVAAVAGGIGSKLAGGSFIDGAQTAAYGFLFNHLNHEQLRGFWDVDPNGFPNGTNPLAGEGQLMVAGGAAALTVGIAGVAIMGPLTIEASLAGMTNLELNAVIGAARPSINQVLGSGVPGAVRALMSNALPVATTQQLLAYRTLIQRQFSDTPRLVHELRTMLIDRFLRR